jgi:hypothetical protein
MTYHLVAVRVGFGEANTIALQANTDGTYGSSCAKDIPGHTVVGLAKAKGQGAESSLGKDDRDSPAFNLADVGLLRRASAAADGRNVAGCSQVETLNWGGELDIYK